MGRFLFWLNHHWFSCLQSLGIIGGLLFTAISLRREGKAKRLSNILQLNAQHRELWSEVSRRPELARIFQTEVDILSHPITAAEENFLQLVISHFDIGFWVVRQKTILPLSSFKKDVQWFFALPIPKRIWQESKSTRDPRFVSFVDAAIAGT